jgi:beta-phosphoglucomutase-like phosphatase (HAD superfamily)
MDGTLIDSEELHWISWRYTMAKEGNPITREQFLSSFGQRNDSMVPRWLGAASTPERVERISIDKEELTMAIAFASMACRRCPEFPIGSAAPRPSIEIVLESLQAANYFQAIVSAEDGRVTRVTAPAAG